MDFSRPFTTAQGLAAGFTPDVLAGPRFTRIFRGAYVASDVTVDFVTRVRAALLVLPHDTAVSHVTAMRLYGFDPGGFAHLEFSTNTRHPRRIPGITLHRRRGHLHPRDVDGLPALGPDRTFVDVALRLRMPQLVGFGDHLLHHEFTTIDDLAAYVGAHHLDGVRRARRTTPYLDRAAESARESFLRLMLQFARLPEAEVNGVVRDDAGGFLARCDLVVRRWKVVIEYDGFHHLRDPRQWAHDLRRRELLEAAGWIVIVVTADDLRRPITVPVRVHDALVRHGYTGPAPVLNTQWHRWFSTAPPDVSTFKARTACVMSEVRPDSVDVSG